MAEQTNLIIVAAPSLAQGHARKILFPDAKQADWDGDDQKKFVVENKLRLSDFSDLNDDHFPQAILSSRAEILLLIVDATLGLQARDYWSKILSSLAAIPHIVLAIDNMAANNWSKDQFDTLKNDFLEQASTFNFSELYVAPVDFQTPEMLNSACPAVSWYKGPPLLELIGTLSDKSSHTPANIETEEADQLAAHIYWLHDEPMLPGRHYELKANKVATDASVSDLKFKINSQERYKQAAKQLQRGEIGYVNISLDAAIPFSAFEQDQERGYFELFDKQSGDLAGFCLIKHGLRRATNIKWQQMEVNKSARASAMGQNPCILWFTGLSGSGKSTIASLVEKKLHQKGLFTYALDGDNVRHGLCRDLGFTDADRVENLRRISETAKLFVDAGMVVLASFISPFQSERQEARELFEQGEFLEIYVDTPLEICELRDPKGLYKLARAGELKNFTGLDSPYEAPEFAEITLAGADFSAEKLADEVLIELEKRGLIQPGI